MSKRCLDLFVLAAYVSFGASACFVPIGGTGSDSSRVAANTRTFAAVNPKPRVVVEGESGKFAVDLGTVLDEQTPGAGLNVVGFRQSLMTGFKNMTGASFTPQPKDAKLVLAVEQAELARANIGQIGGYIIIRYRATWSNGNGAKLASLTGVAEPRNPTEPGPRHLEDVIEVMYEEMVGGLERAQGVKVR